MPEYYQHKNKCACGRILHRGDTTCSFCRDIERRLNVALLELAKNPKTKKTKHKCSKCGTEIPFEEKKMFNEMCFECYTKKVRNEGI